MYYQCCYMPNSRPLGLPIRKTLAFFEMEQQTSGMKLFLVRFFEHKK